MPIIEEAGAIVVRGDGCRERREPTPSLAELDDTGFSRKDTSKTVRRSEAAALREAREEAGVIGLQT